MSPILKAGFLGLLFAIVVATTDVLCMPMAIAATAPIKEIEGNHIGREVNKAKVEQVKVLEAKGGTATTAELEEENICSVGVGACQPATASGASRGFNFAKDVAVAPDGDIYVADGGNHRVQELTANGGFVLMLGRNVNKTEEKEGAPQSQRDICTAASGDVCQAGQRSEKPGEMETPMSVVIDAEGNIYVAELVLSANREERGERVQKLSPAGEFLFEIGKEVNETTKGNLCVKGENCKGPALNRSGTPSGADEPGALDFETAIASGNILAMGGPSNLLYVANKHRIQEFEGDGSYKTEISLSTISNTPGNQVDAVAVDGAGDVYLVYVENLVTEGIREFGPNREQLHEFLDPAASGSLAVNASGNLAVSEFEKGEPLGSLYGLDLINSELHLITSFSSDSSQALAFGGDDLYAINSFEVVTYSGEPVGELATTPASCAVEAEHETDATSKCELSGRVDAWGVKSTLVWFRWGQGLQLDEETAPVEIKNMSNEGEEEPPVPISAPVNELRPNETFRYQMVGEDAHVQNPEELSSTIATFSTPLAAPKAIGDPTTSFVKSDSAVMFSELNPENATTEYFFEYAPESRTGEDPLSKCINIREESCPGVATTESGVSAAYGRIGTTLEAIGLQPATTYHYRLFAESQDRLGHEKRQVEAPGEGTFVTGVAPVPSVATGGYGSVSPTSAVISGSVSPEGQSVSYAFEVGVNRGASTQYGTVFTGSTTASATPTEEMLELTGLQPGTSYSYRITIKSGFIENEAHSLRGTSVSFETSRLPGVVSVPKSLEMLAIPSIVFPHESVNRKVMPRKSLADALKACRKKKSKSTRLRCERTTRKIRKQEK